MFALFVGVCTSQVASFSGWECVQCGLIPTAHKKCGKCRAHNTIAGAACGLVIFYMIFLFY